MPTLGEDGAATGAATPSGAATQRAEAMRRLAGESEEKAKGPRRSINTATQKTFSSARAADSNWRSRDEATTRGHWRAVPPCRGLARSTRPLTSGAVAAQVGLLFARQMEQMVAELDSTRCNFIRCIKPNPIMKAGVFDNPYSVAQLRHTGMLQCCEMLTHGYPTRLNYSEVKGRYLPVLPKSAAALLGAMRERDFARAVLYGFEVDAGLFQLGLTKLFFRAGVRARPGAQMHSRASVARLCPRRFLASPRASPPSTRCATATWPSAAPRSSRGSSGGSCCAASTARSRTCA